MVSKAISDKFKSITQGDVPAEGTPEYDEYLEKLTAPPVQVKKASELKPVPPELAAALELLNNRSIRKDRRPFEVAKAVRLYYSNMDWPDEEQPESVRDFLLAKGIPVYDTFISPTQQEHLLQEFSNIR